ncbi:MAG: MFS transporter [Acidobacteriia bacterium]|nr:MFS transporter [Terriglobia bacterium]
MPVAGIRASSLISAPLAWENNPRLPRGVAAVLAALRFSAPAPEPLRQLSDAEWKATLEFIDRGSLTLFLGAVCRDYLPAWVRERIDRNLAGNTERIGRLRASLVEIAAQFEAAGIEYLLLKGFSQEVEYAADPYLRVSYDLDLFAPQDSLSRAHAVLRSMAYETIEGTGQSPADHLPPMIRKTGWQWRGDFFDPEIPGSIDLHYRFWDPGTELFDAPGVEDFWQRRIQQDGLPVLDRADRLGYAALHLLRHLLRAGVRLSHVYEIAYFLETQAGDDSFWDAWRELHPAPLRRLEALSFRLAAEWFGCRTSPVVQEQMESEEEDIQLWFTRYRTAPLEASFHPNKHELWLHFALLASSRDRRRVFMRRVLPFAMPGPVDAVYLPDDQVTWRMRLRRQLKYGAHVVNRSAHHARALVPVTVHGLIWKSRGWRLDASFWRFLAGSTLLNLGVFHFLLLYNLYLLDQGFRENVLGVVAGAFTAGSLAGVLPAAALARRFGLKRTLLVSIAATAVVCALRAAVTTEPALLAAAFSGGVLFSTWAVCISPAVAAVTVESARPTAFSFVFGSGIGLGVAAGILGGRLPGWFARAGLASSPAQAKQLVLFAASLCVGLALWPLARLRLQSPPAHETRSYPRGPFIRQFLVAIGVWSLATGAFNPLFNAYFARQFHLPVERIGLAFSISQAASAAAILAAPFVLRRLGLIRGVAATQFATAAILALLAPAPTALVAVALYAAYSSFQYMTEPGVYSSLMNRVPPSQHSGASALNFLVVFGSQALAASAAGVVVAHYGYPPMLAGAAGLAALAAWLFSRLKYD